MTSHQLALIDDLRTTTEYRVVLSRGNPPRTITHTFGAGDRAKQRATDYITAVADHWTTVDVYLETRHVTEWVRA